MCAYTRNAPNSECLAQQNNVRNNEYALISKCARKYGMLQLQDPEYIFLFINQATFKIQDPPNVEGINVFAWPRDRQPF
jgi:hypothetical protein